MGFDPILKWLRCIGHIINLITKSYIFGQDTSTQENNFKKVGPRERQKLQRQQGELRKLYNLVVHVVVSSKCTDLFKKLQVDANISVISKRIQKLVLDSSIRQNSTYAIIRRALELKDVLDLYALKLRVSTSDYDVETCRDDYISEDEQKALAIIKEQLEPLFRATKELEGNVDLKDSAR